MDNRGVKSLTFHKLLHFKEADAVLIQELRSKVHTSQILPQMDSDTSSRFTDLPQYYSIPPVWVNELR
jgi:hypothetical protein